jgi:hypothetical protein
MISMGMGRISSGKEARKLLPNEYLSIQDRVIKSVKYNVQESQNRTCRVMRYRGLLEKISGYTFM